MKYYIYKISNQTKITYYWNRRKQNWSKWFDNNCLYPTERGVDRVYNRRIKYQTLGEIIGWKGLDNVCN